MRKEIQNRERWHTTAVDPKQIEAYCAKFSLDPLIARLLLIRNIGDGNDEDILDFINPPEKLVTEYQYLTSQEDLSKATQRIIKAIENNENIMVNGDPDADGISGGTVLVSGFRALGAEVFYDFPTRSKEGHGLQPRIIDDAKALGCSLIVTADCGSKDVEATEYAVSQDMDVIICDHHVLGRILPPALAIVNPFRVSFPTLEKNLSGAGVAFKLVLAVFDAMKKEVPAELMEYLLAIVTLGTISDRMSFVNPMNRVLINKGIEALKNTEMEGLRALLDISKSQYTTLRSQEIGRTIVPRLNAPGRIGDREEGIPDSRVVLDLLLLGTGKKNAKRALRLLEKFMSVFDAEKRQSQVQEEVTESQQGSAAEEAAAVDLVNEKRKYITSKIEDEIDELIDNQVNVEEDRIIIVRGKNWNPGVIGIDTDRLRDRFLRPAMILTAYDDNEYIRGSVRSIPTINVYKIIDTVGDIFERTYQRPLFRTVVETRLGKKVINAFGGHTQACGFTLHEQDLNAFTSLVRAEMGKLAEEDFQYSYEILDTIEFNEITPELVNKLDVLAPYGQYFEFPIFYLKGCQLSKGRPFGNKYQEARTPHVEFFVWDKQASKAGGERLTGVGFGLWEKFQSLVGRDPRQLFDIIFFVEMVDGRKRKDRGKAILRLNVLDIRRSEDTKGIGAYTYKRKKQNRKKNPQGNTAANGQPGVTPPKAGHNPNQRRNNNRFRTPKPKTHLTLRTVRNNGEQASKSDT